MIDLFAWVCLIALALAFALVLCFGVAVAIIELVDEVKSNKIKRCLDCYKYGCDIGLADHHLERIRGVIHEKI